MKELKLWYSVQNGGDGSAYPNFMESEALTVFDQDNADEGWGECCNGSITISSESALKCDEDVTSHGEYLLGMIEYCTGGDELIKEFLHQFYPDGPPAFKLELESEGGDDWRYVHLSEGGKPSGKYYLKKGSRASTYITGINRQISGIY